MKHGFLPILGIYSPGLYLNITHGKNKLVCLCGFCTELLFAENQSKITGFGVTQQSTEGKPTNYHYAVMLFIIPLCTTQVSYGSELSFHQTKWHEISSSRI